MRDNTSTRLTAEPGPSDNPPDEPHDDVYVHFGDSTHLPLVTLGYLSLNAANEAVRKSRAEGWPARLAT